MVLHGQVLKWDGWCAYLKCFLWLAEQVLKSFKVITAKYESFWKDICKKRAIFGVRKSGVHQKTSSSQHVLVLAKFVTNLAKP